MSQSIHIGPPFKGLELELDAGATPGATVAMDCRVTPDGLRRMDPPNYLSNVTTAVRGMHFHTKADGSKVLLAATATGLYAATGTFSAPSAVLAAETGAAFAFTSSTKPVLFHQDGYWTYMVDTGSALAPVYAWDERDGLVRSLVLPDAPAAVTASVEALAAKVISPLSGTHGDTLGGTAVVGTAVVGTATVSSGYTVVGTWDSAVFNNDPWGEGHVRLNSGASTAVGDGFYFVSNPTLDWRGVRITFDVWSGGNEMETGNLMGFCCGKTAWNEHIIPFAIETAKATNHVTIDLASYIDSDSLNGVRYWGFIVTNAANTFVVSFKDLHKQAGTIGKRTYLFTDVATVGAAVAPLELASPEGPAVPVEADAGTLGSQVVLSGTVPAGVVRKVWRSDTDITTQYHYVGDWTGATYTDTAFDVSLNPTLQRGRVQAPVGAVSLGVHNGILRVGVGNDLKGARIGDPTTWLDMTPEEWVTLAAADLNTATAADGLKLPVSDIGRVIAMAQLGLSTGADFRQDLVLFGDAGMLAVLTGTEPPYAVAHKAPGGVAGPLALCPVPDGLVFVDPQGDVNLLTRTLSVKQLSKPIERVLREQTGRSSWMLGYDPNTSTVVLWAGTRRFAFDFQQGAWTEMGDAWGGATARATAGAAEGAYLCFAGAGGGLYRAMDPDFEPGPWAARMAMALGTVVAPGNGFWYECTSLRNGTAWSVAPVWPTTPWGSVEDGLGGTWTWRGGHPDGWEYLTADYTRRNAKLGMDNAPVRLSCEAENVVNCTVYADDVVAGTGVALWSYPVHCLPYGGARLSVKFEGDNNGALLSASLEAAIRRP